MARDERDPGGGREPRDRRTGEDPAERWFREVILANPDRFDTAVPKATWIAWYPQWTGQGFRSLKRDAAGNPIQGGAFDKPDDCPEGTQAWGQDFCLPPTDQRLRGLPVRGTAGQAPLAPVTFGERGSLSYTGNPLIDMLLYQFNEGRSLDTGLSNIFGWAGGRTPGAFDEWGVPVDQPDVTGRLLSGGGLWWGAPGSVWSPPEPRKPRARRREDAQGAGGIAPPDVSAGPASPPVVAPITPPPQADTGLWSDGETPLQRMLRRRKGSGADWYDPLAGF